MSQVLSQSKPKARKRHVCEWCGRVIDPGETYHRAFIVGDDGPYAWVNCSHCSALVRLCPIYEDEDEGTTIDDILEWEPALDDSPAILWKAQWRRGWRDAHGALYPVPTSDGAKP